ncbi:hypothetical protein BGW80DRAFT_1467905 [Lactifluus volemus]|nr:hypothetical protein BGW80DRAFT_1467905 [Lactifluus volemus]
MDISRAGPRIRVCGDVAENCHAHEAPHHQVQESLSLQTRFEHPTPTLPSSSHSASDVGSGRPRTRPLRSSPLANAPVSSGDEEEVKGEKPSNRDRHLPISQSSIGQWDSARKPPSPSPSEVAPPAKERPMTALTNKPSSSASPAPIVAAPVPMLNQSGFSLGAARAKPVVDGSTNLAIPSVFESLKPGLLSLTPKPFTLGTTPKVPFPPAAGQPFGALFGTLPLAAAPATMTLPKDTIPLEPMARKFMSSLLRASTHSFITCFTSKLGELSREQREQRTPRPGHLAIGQQTTDVSTLSIRIAKLIPRIGSGSPSTTPPRAHERELVRRPLDVTPHVASTTAAALNAEQAAHRFKDALLSVRTEPLRNTQAVHASSAPQVYDTPQKLGTSLASKGGSGGLFSMSFTLPPLNIVASTNTAASPPWSLGRRATPPKHHAKSVPLKSTPTSTVGVAAFDWGPLLAIKPMTTLWSGSRIDIAFFPHVRFPFSRDHFPLVIVSPVYPAP